MHVRRPAGARPSVEIHVGRTLGSQWPTDFRRASAKAKLSGKPGWSVLAHLTSRDSSDTPDACAAAADASPVPASPPPRPSRVADRVPAGTPSDPVPLRYPARRRWFSTSYFPFGFQMPTHGAVTTPPSIRSGLSESPTRPPQVRLPTSLPTPARRKYHGMASPPEPANSLVIITFGPKIPRWVGDVGAVARRQHARQRALQVLDDVGREVAAVIEALVDDRRLLAHLREEVAVETGVAAAAPCPACRCRPRGPSSSRSTLRRLSSIHARWRSDVLVRHRHHRDFARLRRRRDRARPSAPPTCPPCLRRSCRGCSESRTSRPFTASR